MAKLGAKSVDFARWALGPGDKDRDVPPFLLALVRKVDVQRSGAMNGAEPFSVFQTLWAEGAGPKPPLAPARLKA